METLRVTGTAEDDERVRRFRTLITVSTLALVMLAPMPLWFLQVPWWVLVLVPVGILVVMLTLLSVTSRRARASDRIVLALEGDHLDLDGRRVPLSEVSGAAVRLFGTEQQERVASQIEVQVQDGEEIQLRLAPRPTPEVREIYRRLRQRLKQQGVKVGWQHL